METLTVIVSFVIAIALVVTKLMLEHQYDMDKAKGIAQDRSAYTFKGMLRLMKYDRKATREEKREARRAERDIRMGRVTESASLNVREFSVPADHNEESGENIKEELE